MGHLFSNPHSACLGQQGLEQRSTYIPVDYSNCEAIQYVASTDCPDEAASLCITYLKVHWALEREEGSVSLHLWLGPSRGFRRVKFMPLLQTRQNRDSNLGLPSALTTRLVSNLGIGS